MVVNAADLRKLTEQILRAGGSNETEASIVASNLVESNLKGHDSHGVGYLSRYIPGIKSGLLKVNQHAEVISDKGPVILVEGHIGFGQVIGKEAIEMGIKKCKEHGVAVVGVRNSHHLARIGKWAEAAAREGFVCIAFTNVAGHDPLVAPFGGKDARLGTNPFTIGFPGLAGGDPVLLDFATSEVALGKVREKLTAGSSIRLGALLDQDGKPTTDPKHIPPDHGALVPLGSEDSGYKGWGLALMCELLGGVLTGGWNMEPTHFRSHDIIVNSMTAILIDPAALGGSAWSLQGECSRLFEYCKASPLQNPDQPIFVPGEMEVHYLKLRTKKGIPMMKGTYEAMITYAKTMGLNEKQARATLGGTPSKLYEDRFQRYSQV